MILNSAPFFKRIYNISEVSNVIARPHAQGLVQVPHRGLHFNGIAPENSIDSVHAAARCGFKVVECDILRTSDGEWVVMHDSTINRTMYNKDTSIISGAVGVSSHTYQQLRDSYVYKSDRPEMRKPISRFDDYLTTCRYLGVKVVAEIKDSSDLDHVAAVMQMATEIIGTENVIWQSFDWAVLWKVRETNPKSLIYALTNSANETHIATLEAMKPYVYFPRYSSVTSDIVKAFSADETRVAVWTTPPAKVNDMVKLNVMELCSNHPAPPYDISKVVKTFGNINEAETTGSVVDGQLVLSAGETVSFAGEVTELGAYYAYLYIADGGGTITGANLTSSPIEIGNFITESILVEQSSSITITAGTAGMVIDKLKITQCNF